MNRGTGVLAILAVLPMWLWLVLWPSPTMAEDRVTVRGNYYRERSTRILQPMVDVSVDAPDERLTIGATYLLDAISSASIASGTTAVTGGDNVFTEIRHEASGRLSSKLGPWMLGALFLYSTETDYQSRVLSASVGREFLQRSMTLTFGYGYQFDRIFRIFDGTGRRLPWCGGAIEPMCSGGGAGVGSNLLQVHRFSLGYAHALHRTVLLGTQVEYENARGPQDNPYRGEQIPNVLFETHPLKRNRIAITPELWWHIPQAHMTLEPRYRFYADDWDVVAHAPELRVHFRVVRHLRVRLRYRFYTQSAAFFWRDDNQYQESTARCTDETPEGCATADPKMDAFVSHTPGIQLTYELDGLARYRGLGWLENGWIQATYNHLFQTNRFGNARLGSMAFSLAF